MTGTLRMRRRGMTLVEVMFAIVLLSGVMLALSRFGTEFTKATKNSEMLAVASDLATARIEVVRAHANYATLSSTFHAKTETAATKTARPSMAAYPGYTRTTAVSVVTTDTARYTMVTVTVSADRLAAPMKKSVVIGAF